MTSIEVRRVTKHVDIVQTQTTLPGSHRRALDLFGHILLPLVSITSNFEIHLADIVPTLIFCG